MEFVLWGVMLELMNILYSIYRIMHASLGDTFGLPLERSMGRTQVRNGQNSPDTQNMSARGLE